MAPPMKELCSACQKPYTESEIVQCDESEEWLHYKCVGVDDSVADQPWKCLRCGGRPYKADEKVEKTLSKPEPTIENLMELLMQTQEREERLKEEFTRVTDEYGTD